MLYHYGMHSNSLISSRGLQSLYIFWSNIYQKPKDWTNLVQQKQPKVVIENLMPLF